MSETKPITGSVRLGIEMEGVGVLKMTWDPRRPSLMVGLSKADKSTLTEEQQEQVSDMKETLKKQPLVRSASFSEDFSKPVRGVSIHPEMPNSNASLGREHPAELVSTPHLLDGKNLTYLKNSVLKVVRGGTKGVLSGKKSAQTHTLEQTDLLPQSTIKTEFTDETRGKLPQGIQTTVGIAADKLLSSDPKTRKSIIEFMTMPSSDQQKRFTQLVTAACSADGPMGTTLSGDLLYRFRLMLLMSLLHACVPDWKGGGMEKDIYGANIKGYSSFEGCAFEDQIGLQQLVNRGEELVSALEKAGIAKDRATEAVDKIGFPDLSAQVAFEGGSPIASFLVNGRLHTVIEARQKGSPINQCIYKMLLAKPTDLTGKTTDPAAKDAAQVIRTAIGVA